MAENDNFKGGRRASRAGKESAGRPHQGRSGHHQSRNRTDRNHTDHNGRPRGERSQRFRAESSAENRPRRSHDATRKPRRTTLQIPEWAEPDLLPSDIRRELRMLSKENADRVASHMIASYGLLAEDPEAALAHAYAARDHAGRIAVVREHAGIIAYLTEHWQEALGEFRTARRIGGGPGLLSLMADCERGLGRPERAIEMLNSDYVAQLDDDGRAELRIVVAGAHADRGEHDAALAVLEEGNLDPTQTGSTSARYFYAYADALLAVGRKDDALTWFHHAAISDDEASTDALQRIEELTN